MSKRDIARGTYHYQTARVSLQLRTAIYEMVKPFGIKDPAYPRRIKRDELELEEWADELNAAGDCIECRTSPDLPKRGHIHRGA